METLVSAFMSDPFKIILGSGGILGLVSFGVNLWRNRARPRVRLLKHTYNSNGSYECPTVVDVEIENVGREPTSVETKVLMTCRYPGRGEVTGEFQVTDGDRSLAPVTPRTIHLAGNPPVSFIFSHFREYTFRFSRGSAVKLRVLNASGKTAGPLKFWFLKWLYVFTGVLPHVKG